jgi:hypothetical protein
MHQNCKFVIDCIALKEGEVLEVDKLLWDELFNLMYPIKNTAILRRVYGTIWFNYEITAVCYKQTNDVVLPNDTVRIWMVSRMGDIGVTKNLVNPKGYDIRTDIDNFRNFKIKRIRQ